MTILADEVTRAYDNAYALWNDPILFLACLVILVMGLYLGVTVVLAAVQIVRLLVIRRRVRRSLDQLGIDFTKTKTAVQDQLFANLDLEKHLVDLPPKEKK